MELDNMIKLSDNCNIQVPMEVLKSVSFLFFFFFTFPFHYRYSYSYSYSYANSLRSLIDDGKNPDEFTKDVLNSCIAKNQITKGKTDAFKVPSPQSPSPLSHFPFFYAIIIPYSTFSFFVFTSFTSCVLLLLLITIIISLCTILCINN